MFLNTMKFWKTHRFVTMLPNGTIVCRPTWPSTSKYMPHQGYRECERRRNANGQP